MRRRHCCGLVLSLLVTALLLSPASAEVKLPAVFAPHMVLQQELPVPVWGWADDGEKVTVTLGEQAKTTVTDSSGKWSVELDPLKAGGPHTLIVEGENRIAIEDVLVGEVWLCSGQSNMAMTVSRSANFEQEQAAADHPGIRMFTVARHAAVEPQDDCQGDWKVCTPDTVGGFSATAYFFGRRLHKELDVPVGLINSSWGGTPVQAWTSVPVQKDHPQLAQVVAEWQKRIEAYDAEAAGKAYQKKLERWKKALKAWKEKRAEGEAKQGRPPRRPRPPADPVTASHRPGNLYNGMIAPLVPFAIQGAIWYQGESNAGHYQASLYGLQLASMIENWRNVWKQGEFPFLWVQLPNFRAPQQSPVETDGWVIVQEEMLETLAVPNTGMAITIDVGEANDIHPKNKQDVGRRLAQWALAMVYDKDLVRGGPVYQSMEKRDGKIVLHFDNVGDGLASKTGKQLQGFAVAGADKQFVWADARIEGDTVVVSSPKVDDPVAVRYAWASNPRVSLYNKAGLPASPFRTDDWQQ
jgi:sialate O-acetylesterase